MQVLYRKGDDEASALMLLATVALADLPVLVTPRNDNKLTAASGKATRCLPAPATGDASSAMTPWAMTTTTTAVDADAVALPSHGVVSTACAACVGAAPSLTLLDEDGVDCDVFEPHAILRYVARLETYDTHHLYGRTPVEASQVDAWLDFAAAEVRVTAARVIAAMTASATHDSSNDSNNNKDNNSDDGGNTRAARRRGEDGDGVAHEAQRAAALAAFARVLAALDTVLSIRTFLVGERMTIADVAVAFALHRALRGLPATVTLPLLRTYRAAYRHYNTVMRQPKIRDVMRREGAAIGPAY